MASSRSRCRWGRTSRVGDSRGIGATLEAAPPASKPSGPPERGHVLHLVGGPLIFVLALLLPLGDAPLAVRGALGLLVWMAWWWIAAPVDLAVTALLPLVVTAL